MKFLLALLLVSCSAVSFAQIAEESSLFPELNVLKSEKSKESVSSEPSAQKENKEEENTTVSKEIEQTPVIQDSPKDETKDEEEEKQQIGIIFDNIDATLTPNRHGSFCSISLGVFNGTKKELNGFSGVFTIGKSQESFNFSKIKSKEGKGKSYTFIGRDCEMILNTPQTVLQKCQIEGWSEQKCKAAVVIFSSSNSGNTAR